MGGAEALGAHLASGLTTLARCWAITRKDGVRLGFTDHDRPLSFEGLEFKADSGLTAATLEQGTGLSVDNSEALGALSDASVREEDIETGRFDDAEVTAWLVNWQDVAQRRILFRGAIGEITRANGVFRAELRGLTEALNRPLGRVYQRPCTAVLGDANCRFQTDSAGYQCEVAVATFTDRRVFDWPDLAGFDEGWFLRGAFEFLDGAAKGLRGMIKADTQLQGLRRIELWEPIRADIVANDRVRLIAGCDKRFDTCREKFLNHLNFQGFPDIPGEDWLISVPRRDGANTGGSLR